MFVRSFPPLAYSSARVLILGSMPGVASLQKNEYYAHPRNAFWPIMDELFGCGVDVPYAQRVAHLQQYGIAVWDVLQCCVREGSLDSDIARASEQANDLPGLFRAHPQLHSVFFNGSKVQQVFRKHLEEDVTREFPHLVLSRLPSTSPAHAGMSLAEKMRAWRVVAERLNATSDLKLGDHRRMVGGTLPLARRLVDPTRGTR